MSPPAPPPPPAVSSEPAPPPEPPPPTIRTSTVDIPEGTENVPEPVDVYDVIVGALTTTDYAVPAVGAY